MRFAGAPDWSSGFLAVERTFGFGPSRRLHLFRSEQSIEWARFTEPQFTRGLAYFLNDSDPDIRAARVLALLTALGAAKLGRDIQEVTATAEKRIEENRRIDLLLEWKDSEGKCYAVALEAKLGHDVTTGQLRAYRRYLQGIAGEGCWDLVVVSPRLCRKTEVSLRRNRDWRWVAWRDLLVAHERALQDERDDCAYRLFRRNPLGPSWMTSVTAFNNSPGDPLQMPFNLPESYRAYCRDTAVPDSGRPHPAFKEHEQFTCHSFRH